MAMPPPHVLGRWVLILAVVLAVLQMAVSLRG
jgi:hypothetical protein